MDSRGRQILVQVALEQKLLTPDQVQFGLQAVQSSPSLSLEQVWLQQKWLTAPQIQYLHQLVRRRMSQRIAAAAPSDEEIGRLVLTRKMLLPGQLNWARERQAQLAAFGQNLRLGAILVEAELITSHQYQTLCREWAQSSSHPTPSPTSSPLRTTHGPEDDPATLVGDGSPSHREEESPSEEEDSLVGRRLNQYEVVELIARGGMGVVYRARDCNLRREVALKTILAGEEAGVELIQRFMVEAKGLAKLRHPHIVRVYEVGKVGRLYFFTMDYIQGRPLSKILAEREPADRECLQWILQVARAVHYSHTQGILHRDLKPSNIIIDDSGEARVMDFGLAKEVDSDRDITRTGATIGTPAYMSPEQAQGKKREVDHRTDVYALGAILYELATGTKAFEGESSMAVIYRVVTEEPTRPGKLNRQIPRDLETIILKAMEKERGLRYETAGDLARDLEAYLQGEAILARPHSFAYRLGKLAKRNQMASAAVGFLLVVSVALFSLYFQSQRKQRAERKRVAEKKRQVELENLLQGAKGEMAQGKWLGAEKSFRKVLEIDGKEKRAWLGLARVYFAVREPDRAEKCVGRALEVDSNYAHAYLEQGKIFAHQGKYKAARASLDRALDLDRSMLAAYRERARVWEKLGRTDWARRDREQGKKILAQGTRKEMAKSENLYRQGAYLAARYRLNQVIEALPRHGSAHILRGRCYWELGDYDRAYRDLSRAIEISPDKVEYIALRGDLSLHFHRLSQAHEDYRRALAKGGSRSTLSLKLGQIYFRQHRYFLALQHYQKAREKGLNSGELALSTARVMVKLRLYDKGLVAVNRALKRGLETAGSYFVRGQIHYLQKKYPLSIKDLKRSYEMNPSPQTSLLLARGWIEMGQWDKAEARLAQIEEVSAEREYEWARLFAAKKDWNRAGRRVNRAIDRAPWPQSDYYELRGDIEMAQRDHEGAQRDFWRALERDWTRFSTFDKFLKASVYGLLLDQLVEKFANTGENFLMLLPRRNWLHEVSLFAPEEEELREKYFRSSTSLQGELSKSSEKLTREAVQSLTSPVQEMSRMARDYLVRLGEPALEVLVQARANIRGTRGEVIDEVIDEIRRRQSRQAMDRLARILIRIYLYRDVVARKELHQMGEARWPLIQQLFFSSRHPLLLRFYAAREYRDSGEKQRMEFLRSQLAHPDTKGILAAATLSRSYHTIRKVQEVLLAGLSSSRPLLQALALDHLALEGEEVGTRVKKLIEKKGGDYRVRLLAAARLFLKGDKSVFPVLLDQMDSEESRLRIYLCQIFAKSKEVQVLSYLRRLLQDRDGEVRTAAVVALRNFSLSQVEDDLLKRLQDRESTAQVNAMVLLMRMGSQKVVPHALKILGNHRESMYFRMVAFNAIGDFSKLGNLLGLVNLLPKLQRDPNPLMRSVINIVIGSFASKVPAFKATLINLVKQAMKDSNGLVKCSAIMAMAIMGEASYRHEVVKLFRETRDATVEAAAAAAVVILFEEGFMKDYPNILDEIKGRSKWVRMGAAFGYYNVAAGIGNFRKMSRQGERDLKIRYLKRACDIYSSYGQAYISLAELNWELRKRKEAYKYYTLALTHGKKYTDVLRNVAKGLKDLERVDEARAVCDQWIELAPYDYQAYFFRARFSSRGQRGRYFRLALLAMGPPCTVREYEHSLHILREFGLDKEARRLLQRGLRENGDRRLYEWEVNYLMDEWKYKEALHYLKIYGRKNNGSYNRQQRMQLGICYLNLKRYQEALGEFRVLQKAGDDYPIPAWIHTARCYEKMGQVERARRILVRMVKFYRNEPRVAAALGAHYHRREKYRLAGVAFQRALAMKKGQKGRVFALIALNHAAQGEKEKCIENLRKSVKNGFIKLYRLRSLPGYKKAIKWEEVKVLFEK